MSAYFYCKKIPQDQLCATVVVNAKDVDLLEFAKHWGNYGLRQFGLGFLDAHDVVDPDTLDEVCRRTKGDRGHGDVCVPAWYKQKQYLSSLHAAETAETSLPESTISWLLSPVQDILSKRYAAVGILEEWQTTMELFDATLGIEGFEWVRQFQTTGKTNDGKFVTAEHRALKEAWMSSELKSFIWLDILLYDHAVAVHKMQVAQYLMP